MGYKKISSRILALLSTIILGCVCGWFVVFGIPEIVQDYQNIRLGYRICHNLKAEGHLDKGWKCYTSTDTEKIISSYFPVGSSKEYFVDAMDGISRFFLKSSNLELGEANEDGKKWIVSNIYRYRVVSKNILSFNAVDVYFYFIDGELIQYEIDYRDPSEY